MTNKPSRKKEKGIISRLPYTFLVFMIFGLRFLSLLPKKVTDYLFRDVLQLFKTLRR